MKTFSQTMTRRRFFYDCTAALAVMAVFPASVVGRPVDRGFRSLKEISYAQLAAQVGAVFRVHSPSGRVVELRLLKAPLAAPSSRVPGRPLRADAQNEKFSLIFTGPRDRLLPEGIHAVKHDELGSFDMYIGQIGMQNRERVRYQSIFNRPAPEAGPVTNPQINQHISYVRAFSW